MQRICADSSRGLFNIRSIDVTMGLQKKRPMLEPVLENYMGPPISYNSTSPARKPLRSSAKVVPVSGSAKRYESKSVASSLNPVNIFGKLRDRYIKAMNELSMGGDLASVAGYHGCVAGTEYPGAVEQHHASSAAREKEIRALRAELAARRRVSSELAEESDDEDLGIADHHRCKAVR